MKREDDDIDTISYNTGCPESSARFHTNNNIKTGKTFWIPGIRDGNPSGRPAGRVAGRVDILRPAGQAD